MGWATVLQLRRKNYRPSLPTRKPDPSNDAKKAFASVQRFGLSFILHDVCVIVSEDTKGVHRVEIYYYPACGLGETHLDPAHQRNLAGLYRFLGRLLSVDVQ